MAHVIPWSGRKCVSRLARSTSADRESEGKSKDPRATCPRESAHCSPQSITAARKHRCQRQTPGRWSLMHSSEATLHLPLRERFSWHALRSLGSLASTALIDQALVSGSNFLLGIVLARTLDPNQYGAFGVAFSVFLLLSLVHQSLILEPMGVFGPSQYADRLKQYVGTLLQIQTAV